MKILKYLKKRDWIFLIVSVALIVGQVWLELKMPDYSKSLSTAVSSNNINLGEVWKNGGMMILCAFGAIAFAITTGIFTAIIAADFAKNIRSKMFDKITSFSNADYDKFKTSSLITRITNDVVQIQNFLAIGTQLLFIAPITAIWALCKITVVNLSWTMAVLITVIVMVISIGIMVAITFPKFKKIQKLTDELNNKIRENISGVKVIRAFNAEEYQSKKFGVTNDEITKNNLFTSRVLGALMPLMMLALNGLTVAIYWIGAIIIKDAPSPIEKATELGNMVAFASYGIQIVMAFVMLVAIFIILPRTMVSIKRANEVLDAKPTVVFGGNDIQTESSGEIEFKNVSFSYYGEKSPCLNNLSFKINKGETFAIIGATGSGKSTLVNLIARFYDVSSGEILLNGVNLKEYSEKDIQNKISMAPQRAILFKGDVKSNVTYGSDVSVDDNDEKLINCLKLAQADFVFELEKGIHSDVAQGGTNFSGGQKQRLSIARSLFKNSEIVIFDDTFSALDYKTDMLVRKGINENLKDLTKIIVAQRIGTIKNANQILVLDQGEIKGIGTHDMLLSTCPIYKEIALSQLKEEEL